MLTVSLGCVLVASDAAATEWFVARGSSGSGTAAAPFGTIQEGLDAAQPGDVITVGPGTYPEALRTVRSGVAGLPIRLRAQGGLGTVIVSVAGVVLRVEHGYQTVDGIVLDGQYAAADTLLIRSRADYFTLTNSEVRRSSHDLIDIAAPRGVLIDRSSIHHALNAAGGRSDAHGIAAGAVQDLTIRDSEIHTFSGDGVQVDPGRSVPGWDRITIERSRIWLAPLPRPENGFAAGVVPGENAIDTKANPRSARSTLTIRDTSVWGFRDGLITNMAAFNLKEHVDIVVDGVTVRDSEIAFRTRGPGRAAAGAWVTIMNAVIYDVSTAFRYEDDIERLRVLNTTVGNGVPRAFQAASSASAGLEVRNLLVLGSLPRQAADRSNRSVSADAFVDAAAHNYMLSTSSPAIDTGAAITAVARDRRGVERPRGTAYDVGAYEHVPPDDGTSSQSVNRTPSNSAVIPDSEASSTPALPIHRGRKLGHTAARTIAPGGSAGWLRPARHLSPRRCLRTLVERHLTTGACGTETWRQPPSECPPRGQTPASRRLLHTCPDGSRLRYASGCPPPRAPVIAAPGWRNHGSYGV
jgi:hypothetical protein